MPRKKNKYQIFVERFLKDTKSLKVPGWRREVAIAKKLFDKFQDDNFFISLKLDFKLNSLAWFLSKEGKYTLAIRGKMMKYSPPKIKKYNIQKRKIGKSKYVTKPTSRKTLIEILNESKKN